MKQYGIIGTPIAHSFSAQYFTNKFTREGIEACYTPHEVPHIEQVMPIIRQLDGCNITIPYKETIIPYLSEVDAIAQQIGAVNVVDAHNKGWNTDYLGFARSIQPLLTSNDRNALVLGTGGAAKAIAFALKQLGLTVTMVSRHTPNHPTAYPIICYEQLTADMIRQHTVIVNCTPLGMWPQVNECPLIPYQVLSSAHLLYDCIYNPEETQFLRQGRLQGARTKNGLEMLYIQADEAWNIWNKTN